MTLAAALNRYTFQVTSMGLCKLAVKLLALMLLFASPAWGGDSHQVNSVLVPPTQMQQVLALDTKNDANQKSWNSVLEQQTVNWDEHGKWLVAAALVFLVLLSLITILEISRRRKIAATKHLQASEERFRTRLDAELEHKRRYEEGLELLLDLHRCASQMTEAEIFDFSLDIAVRTTKSKLGYLYLLHESQNTMSLLAQKAEARHGAATAIDDPGIWMDCAREYRPAIHNDFQNQTGSNGRLHRYMCTSLPQDDQSRIILSVGNKASDYVHDDSQQLQLIASEVKGVISRRRAEQLLRDSEARFRFISEQAPVMIWVNDENRQHLWANKNWHEFTGAGAEQQDMLNFCVARIHPDDLESNRAIYASHISTHERYQLEYQFRRSDGEYRWVLDIAHPRFDDAGEFRGYVGNWVDITEKKRAELELQVNAARYRILLNSLPQYIWQKDLNSVYVSANQTFARMVRLAHEDDVAGKTDFDFFPADPAEEYRANDRHVIASGKIETWEDVSDKYGKKTYYRRTKVPVRDEQGTIYGTLGFAEDITEQRQAEDQLRKLAQAVEQSPESIVILNLKLEIEYVNRTLIQATGFSREEVVGQNPRFLMSGRTTPETYASVWDSLQRGLTWHGELIARRKDGSEYTEHATITPIRQADGDITHYLAIKKDLTDRIRTELAIRESKTLLQRVIDSTPDWITVKDKAHRFVLVNRSFASAVNLTPDNLIGCLDTDLIPTPTDSKAEQYKLALHAEDDAVLAGQTVHKTNSKYALPNGQVRVAEIIKLPLRDTMQDIYGILCYHRDNTERFNREQEQKTLETQLRQSQKMELIGQLTGGIAHDFNNILASIFGYTELIAMSSIAEQDLKVRQYIEEVLRAGGRAKELVAQLLTFSQKKETTTESIDIAPIVKEVTKLMRATLPASITLSTTLAKRLPEALISPIHLHQILMNLCVNARDATKGSGSIEIGARIANLDGAEVCDSCQANYSGEYLMLSVRDNGMGIAPEQLPKIFDPFFTTKAVGAGSGLGLSVLHGIVHSANGHIRVLSSVGEGSEFRIYLPAQSRRAEDPAPAAEPEINAVQALGHVMVVDDEASIVNILTAQLRNLGCRVTGLTSARKALQVFHDNPDDIDMVITDQTMPDLSGADLARALLSHRPGLPIIMATGYSDEINEHLAREIGIHRFLIKPVPAKVIADIVAECLATGLDQPSDYTI